MVTQLNLTKAMNVPKDFNFYVLIWCELSHMHTNNNSQSPLLNNLTVDYLHQISLSW